MTMFHSDQTQQPCMTIIKMDLHNSALSAMNVGCVFKQRERERERETSSVLGRGKDQCNSNNTVCQRADGAHCGLCWLFIRPSLCSQTTFRLSKIITCQTLFVHNIGYLMCRDTLPEMGQPGGIFHTVTPLRSYTKIIIFDTAASSGKTTLIREAGRGISWLPLVLEAFSHFTTSYFPSPRPPSFPTLCHHIR